MDKTRRKILLGGAAALGKRALPASLTLPWAMASAPAVAQDLPGRFQFDTGWFPLGVASGDPTPDSVIIWTRYAPDPLAPQGGMTNYVEIIWAVATQVTNGQFAPEDIVAAGTVMAKPENGGAIHIDVTGLNPDTEYFYAFMAPDVTISAIGKTKTAPEGDVDTARFGLVSCQRIEEGHYGAFAHMTNDNLDFILHVGDAIYEYELDASYPENVRPALTDLDSYRVRHAVYRGDPQLRAAYEAVPWIVAWDDHEFINNYWSSGAPDLPPSEFLQRRAAAYQAYYENMPIRPPAGLPNPQTGFRIYRQLVFGDLLDLLVLDTRQYRDEQSGDHYNPDRTILGDAQKQWLKNRLSASTARWRGLANQVPMTNLVDLEGSPAEMNDKWQGYAAERAEVLGYIATNGIQNVVSLTGDVHATWASNLKVHFNDQAPNVATEVGGMSVTSGTLTVFEELFSLSVLLGTYALNRHMRFVDGLDHGYVVCHVTKHDWTTIYRSVGRNSPNASLQTSATLRVYNGVPEVNFVSGALGKIPNPF